MSLDKTLNDIAKELQPSDAKLDTIGGMAVDFIRGHLYEGKNFPPLAPATVEYRGRGRPLQDTKELRDSFSYEKKGSGVSVGTNKIYAPIQNDGGRITAKKNWLFIPAAGTRQLQRKYGYSPTEVLNGLKGAGFKVFRMGRTVCYQKKGKEIKVAYYLKKSVVIPKREFFYITAEEASMIFNEVFNDKF